MSVSVFQLFQGGKMSVIAPLNLKLAGSRALTKFPATSRQGKMVRSVITKFRGIAWVGNKTGFDTTTIEPRSYYCSSIISIRRKIPREYNS